MASAQRFAYWLWALKRTPTADRSCPSCGSDSTFAIKRKFLVTALFGCAACDLRFRVPKDDAPVDVSFYEEHYRQGLTTDMPDPAALADLFARGFAGTDRHFSQYIEVVQASGIRPGATICDFGSSWGYGSWQLRQAGYRVYSHEIAPSRARFAVEQLGCTVVDSLNEVAGAIDCFFAAHVIEHMPVPGALWETANSVLKPDGVIVLFLPNGDPSREGVDPRGYHKAWGKVHPLLITPHALNSMAQRAGFRGLGYSTPFDMEQIAQGVPGACDGAELAFIARRSGVANPHSETRLSGDVR